MAPVGAFSRIEVATVEPRPLELVLWGDHGGGTGHEVTASVAGAQHSLALDFPLRIALPEVVGRLAIDLRFPAGVPVRVRRAAVRDARAAGAVEVEADGSVVQHPCSMAMLPFRARGRGSVSGRLEIDPAAGDDALFQAWIDRADGSSTLLAAWHGDETARSVAFEASMDRDEIARLRLVAVGGGPPARWRSLALRTRPVPAPGPTTPPRSPRLVLVYVMDALRADHVGHLGGPADLTPRLDALAAEAAAFVDHRTTAPSTLASTVALFTGRPSVATGPLDPAHGPTLAETFRAAGWRTACISANPNVSGELGTIRGFEQVTRIELDRSHGFRAEVNDSSGRAVEAALDWAGTLADGQLGLLYVHTLNPHNPYAPPEPWSERFATTASRVAGDTVTLAGIRDGKLTPSAADRARLAELYSSGVAYTDDCLGRLVDELRGRFGEDQVLVAATADHDEELFDHDGVLHGYTLYDELLRIPLVVSWPGVVTAARHDLPTDQLDLHATLASLAGVVAEPGDGRSLWGVLTGASRRVAPRPRFAAASRAAGEMVCIVDGGWKLVLAPRNDRSGGMGYGRGRGWDAEYVFDLAVDPAERHNLAGEDRAEWTWLRSRLRGWAATLDRDATQPGVDDATRDSLRALGYVE